MSDVEETATVEHESYWERDFAEHPVHEALQTVQQLLAESEAGNPDHDAHLQRQRTIVGYVAHALQHADPFFVSRNVLKGMNNQLTNMATPLKKGMSGQNQQGIEQASSHIDQLIDLTNRLSIPQPSDDADAAREALRQFRRHAEGAIDSSETRLEGLEQRMTQLEERAESTRTDLTNQKTRIDESVGEFQKQFSEAEARRRETFEAEAQSLSERAETLIAEEKAEAQRMRKDLSREAGSLIESLRTKGEEAHRIVGVIGNVGVTGNYQKQAKAEGDAANTFRWIALTMMLLIVVGVGATLWSALEGGGWQDVLLRTGITLALAVPAAYAAHESERHRQLERKHRQMELELASVDAYLQKLPEEQRQELKAELARRYFGQNDVEGTVQTEVTTSLLDIMKLAIDNLTKQKK